MEASRRTRAARALALTGAAEALRRIGAWQGVLVLNHHRIGEPNGSPFDPTLWSASADQLDEQARFLARHCDVIVPEELEEALRQRGRAVMITFDDGYRDNHDAALPILRSHGIRACFFIATGFVDSPHAAWWDEIAWMMRRCERRTLDARPWVDADVPVGPDSDEAAVRTLTAAYKELPGDRAEEFLDFLADATGSGRCPPNEAASEWMNWDMVRELRAAGMSVGGHTITHPVLSQLPLERQADEIAGCRERLEAELGEPMRAFSYPNGQPSSFDDRTRSVLEQNRVELAFSFYGGFQRADALDRYDVPRTTVEPTTPLTLINAMTALPQLFARD